MAFYGRGGNCCNARVLARIAEVYEGAPRLDVGVAGIHAAREEFSLGGLDVGKHALRAFCQPGGI